MMGECENVAEGGMGFVTYFEANCLKIRNKVESETLKNVFPFSASFLAMASILTVSNVSNCFKTIQDS